MLYINHFMTLVINLVYSLGYLGVVIATGLEYTMLPAPPSEVIIPIIGAMAAQGKFNIILVYLVTILAGLIGSTTSYYIGYFVGRPFIDFVEKKIPKTKGPLHKVNVLFKKYSYISVCIARITPFTRSYISLLAGIEKLNLFKFWGFSALGIGIWNGFLILIGYFVGTNISFIEKYAQKHIYLVIIIVVAIILAAIAYYKFMRKKD